MTTDDKKKALPGIDLDYFQSHFANHEFRTIGVRAKNPAPSIDTMADAVVTAVEKGRRSPALELAGIVRHQAKMGNVISHEMQAEIRDVVHKRLGRAAAKARAKNPRKKGGDSALWRYNRRTGYWTHERNVTGETAREWLHIFMRDEPTEVFLLSPTKPEGGLGALPAMTRNKNPALAIESGPLKAETFLLKLVGHKQGAGYWTGNGWDTAKSKGRVFASFDDAVAHGKRLANTIPATYRIEVHGA